MNGPCSRCGTKTATRRATASAPYLHRAGGLVPVLLSGIQATSCPTCRTEEARLPAARSLRTAVAGALAHRPGKLSGSEIRFLREQAGLAAGRFAALVGIDAAHLSRVENGKIPALGTPADRLVRGLTLRGGGRRSLLRLVEDLADAGPRGPAPDPLRLAWSHRKGWSVVT